MMIECPTQEIRPVTPVDELEAVLASMPGISFPVIHTFTPGLYLRQIFMPAGSLLTSMEHKTEHPFIVISGTVDVMTAGGRETYIGPYMGITKPGTKRVLYTHTDTVWITVHANPGNLTDPDEIGSQILEPNTNPILTKDHPRLNGWKETKPKGHIS
jgi:hypothetical protein